ncbi:MAG TPA: GNAT family N-acetyltransferase [Candidatus Dojkabacteria bacterium]
MPNDNNLLTTWNAFKTSNFYDFYSTVNPHYNERNLKKIENSEFFEEMNNIFLFLKESWIEKDGTNLYLIDYIFDPENYETETVRNLFEKFLRTKKFSGSKNFVGINVDSRLNEYLNDLHDIGFEEVIVLSEMELIMKREFDLPKESKFEIRIPIESELREVYEIVFKTQIEARIGDMVPTKKDFERFINEEMKDLNLNTFVWDGDKAIARITVERYSNHVEIKELAVLPEYWRQGIATYITKLTLNKIYKTGINRIRLYTDNFNRNGAMNLYAKLGFKTLYKSVRIRYKLP